MLCHYKMREQIRICVLQPMHYFLDVNFRREIDGQMLSVILPSHSYQRAQVHFIFF
jgi:hypothetical protein